MKKAFTLSEVLIALVVIGVVIAITIPILNKSRPDKDHAIYRKATFSINSALANIMEENIVKKSPDLMAGEYMSESSFCELFSENLNTTGSINCTSTSSYSSPNFITTDGIRFWGFEGKVFSSSVKERVVHADRKLTTAEQSRLSSHRDSDHSNINTGLRIKIFYDGLVKIDNSWTYEKKLAEKM